MHGACGAPPAAGPAIVVDVEGHRGASIPPALAIAMEADAADGVTEPVQPTGAADAPLATAPGLRGVSARVVGMLPADGGPPGAAPSGTKKPATSTGFSGMQAIGRMRT